jgi:hypothetical protein
MTLNTLRLLYALLCRQQILVGSPREEIDAILRAKEELEIQIAKEEGQ